MQITFFSFIMSLLWFNIYILIINFFRKNDRFIISFSTLPLMFFLSLSIFRLIFNFEISSSTVIRSRSIFPAFYSFIKEPLYLKGYSVKIFQVILFIWVLVAVILLINNIAKYIAFKKDLEKLDDNSSKENEKRFKRILKQAKMENRIDIAQNNNISSPFIIGILKGKIYIPNIDFSQEELEYIIRHEINHFVERDSLKKILIQIIKYMFWWNPFAHLFANDFNQILEIQCDLKTTAGFTDTEKIRYLESITKIIKNPRSNIKKHSSVANFVNIEEIDSLKQRFRIVLNYKGERNLFNVFSIGLCFLALGLYISSYFIIIQPNYEPAGHEIYHTEDIDDSFIIEKPNGSYDIYINSTFKYNIEKLEDLNKTLRDQPIYKGKMDPDE